MKRRFKSGTRDPSHGGVARDLDLGCRYGKSKGKRVRVTDIDREGLANNVSDGIPKTSEYAYFKKVKESMIQQNHHFRDTECDPKLNDAGSYANARHKLKEKMKAPYTNDSIRGSQYLESDIFSAKRQKLRRWAEMSFAGTENFSSNGCDMLTLLLSRLSPSGNENYGSWTTDDTGCSHVLPELDLSEMRHDHSYKRELTTSDFELFQSRELSRWSGATRDMLDWPDFASYNYATKFDANTIPHSEVDNSHALYGVNAKSLLKQIGSPMPLKYEWHGYNDWYHHEEPEKFCLQDESPRREAETLLLDWDFHKEKDEPEAEIVPASSCELIMHSQIVTPPLLPDHSLHVCALPFHLTPLPRELHSSHFSSLYNEDHDNGVSYFLDDLQYTPDNCFGQKRNLDCDAFLLPVVLNVSELNILAVTGFPWREHFSRHCYTSRYGIEPEKALNVGCSNSTQIDFQEASDPHELPCCNFQTSFDRMIGCPLLLEDSNGARSDNEPFIGGSDEWKSS